MQIRHEGPLPQVATIYRGQVCRLELTLKGQTGRLDVAPMSPPIADDRHRE